MTDGITELLKELPPTLPEPADRLVTVRQRIRRRRRWSQAGMLVAAAGACSGVVFLVGHVHAGADRLSTTTPAPTERVRPPIDLGGGERFLAHSSGAAPRLSAESVWRMHARAVGANINVDHPPRGTYWLLGDFVDGAGARHLAYGFFTPNSAPAVSRPSDAAGTTKCIRWDMFDANSAQQLETSWLCPSD